ncbi:MAG: hypothetical protein IH991_07710 [Planctomycetes bacterium]|nr:hypothetical protein [Planctomycetota bacterium]
MRAFTAFSVFLVCILAGCGGQSESPSTGGNPSQGNQEDAYDLRTRYQVGDIIRTEEVLVLPNGQITVGVGAESKKGKFVMEGHFIVEIDVLNADESGPTKLKVTHLRDRTGFGFVLPEQIAEEEVEAGLLEGESILFERTGEKWKKMFVGGALTPDQQKEMDEYVNPVTADIVPNRRVRVGESWTPGKMGLAWFLRDTFGTANGTIHVVFERVADFEGEKCAVLSVRTDITVSDIDIDIDESEMTFSGTEIVHRSLESGLDLHREWNGTLTVKGETLVDGRPVRATFSGPAKITAIAKKL